MQPQLQIIQAKPPIKLHNSQHPVFFILFNKFRHSERINLLLLTKIQRNKVVFNLLTYL